MARRKRYIVKVQLPLVTSKSVIQAYVYDEKRTIEGEFPVTKKLVDEMNGEFKMFFYATMIPNRTPKGTYSISLEEAAPWQEW